MILSQEQKNILITALFANGKKVFLLVDEIIKAILEDKYRQTNTKGDVMLDVPKFYKREGAIEELNQFRSILEGLEQEAISKVVQSTNEGNHDN